jgi:hypothetical protein
VREGKEGLVRRENVVAWSIEATLSDDWAKTGTLLPPPNPLTHHTSHITRTEEVEAALGLEVALLVGLVHRDAHHLRVQLLVLLDVTLEGLGLQGAACIGGLCVWGAGLWAWWVGGWVE